MGKEYVESVTTGRNWAAELAVLYNLLDTSKITPRAVLVLNNIQVFQLSQNNGTQLYFMNTNQGATLGYITALIAASSGVNCGNFTATLRTNAAGGIAISNSSTTPASVGIPIRIYY